MIEDKALKTIRKYCMLKKGDRVLVAFSGGVDSTALIYALNSMRGELKIRLFAAHLDHKLRRKDSVLDAAFAGKTAKKLKIPFIGEEFDVGPYAGQNRLNLEDAARRVRYEFLERAAARIGADRIAVAHTADDNIETFLMRMIRGTGMKGLTGIPPVRGKIVRPFIELFRKDIEEYLRSKKIAPRIDRTNFETKYMRNRIRRNLIPALESYNPRIKDVLLRTISTANEMHDLIEAGAKEALKGMTLLRSPNEIRIDAKKLVDADPALRGEVLRLAIASVRRSLEDISFVHVEDVLGQLKKKRAEIDLPGVYAYIDKGALSISKPKRPKTVPRPFMHKLEVPGEVRGEGFVIEADVLPSVPLSDLRAKNPYRAYVDYDKIAKPLIVRNRRSGDRFSPIGLKGSKKLQDIFVDGKIDIDERGSIPVVEDGRRIVWVVGCRISEDAKVTSSTRRVVELNAKKIR